MKNSNFDLSVFQNTSHVGRSQANGSRK